MSTVKSNNVQVGQSATATNNFTLYQPTSPDGTVRLAVGNSGATTTDILTANSSGNVGIGTSSPAYKLDVNGQAYVGGGVLVGGSVSDSSYTATATAGAAKFGMNATGPYIYTSSATAIQFYTNNSEKMRLDASGNLGLGVTPSAKLEVYSTNNAFNALQVRYNGSNDAIGFGIANANGFPYIGYNTKSQASSDTPVYERTNAATQLRMDNGTFKFNIAPSGTAGNAISFTQAMTLFSSGNLTIGGTNDSARLRVEGTTNLTTGLQLFRSGNSCGAIWQEASSLKFGNDGSTGFTERAQIDSSGNFILSKSVSSGFSIVGSYNETTATAANMVVQASGYVVRSTSALKYKTDVRDLESVDISKFRPVRYKSTCENDDKTIDHIGFIADEYAETYPELVAFGAEGQVEGFAYERVTAVLCKAIQEQQALIQQLQADVAALKAAQ